MHQLKTELNTLCFCKCLSFFSPNDATGLNVLTHHYIVLTIDNNCKNGAMTAFDAKLTNFKGTIVNT